MVGEDCERLSLKDAAKARLAAAVAAEASTQVEDYIINEEEEELDGVDLSSDPLQSSPRRSLSQIQDPQDDYLDRLAQRLASAGTASKIMISAT